MHWHLLGHKGGVKGGLMNKKPNRLSQELSCLCKIYHVYPGPPSPPPPPPPGPLICAFMGLKRTFKGSDLFPLTFTTPLANSADDIDDFFPIFPRKQELSSHPGNKIKKKNSLRCRLLYQECYALNLNALMRQTENKLPQLTLNYFTAIGFAKSVDRNRRAV